MIINNFKTLALASMVGFSSFSAFAQADDMPAKGLVKSMITLPKKQMYAANLVYKAVGADLGKFKLDGWKYKSGTEALTVSNYKSGSKYIATSAPIAVPAVANDESIYLEITEKFSLESDYDFGSVMITADGGNTWQSVHTVTGQSLKRTAQTNISSYAGKTIQIALAVKSDASFEAEGWEVYGIELYRASEGGNTQASSLKSGPVNGKEIRITGTNDDNFPESVFIDFTYSVNGVYQTNLQLKDLDEAFKFNGQVEATQCPLQLFPPQKGRDLDVMFVIDNSGSMGDKQAEILNKIGNFVTLVSTNYNARFGLVRFGYSNSPTTGTPAVPVTPNDYIMEHLTENGVVTDFTNVTNFKAAMLAKNTANSGGYEYSYDAVNYSLGAQFNPSSKRIVVLVTDENAVFSNGLPNENQALVKRDEIIAKLVNQGIQVFSFIPTLAEYDNTYKLLATETGGERYDITGTFDALYTRIGQMLNGTYTLRYCPKTTTYSPLEHCVTLSLSADAQVSDEKCFVASDDKEYIYRSQVTTQQAGTTLQENSVANFCFDVVDKIAPYPTSVTLYAKHANSTVYLPYTMISSPAVAGVQQWCGTVPTSIVLRPLINYYAIAKYADGHEIKSPAVREQFLAYTQAVYPNYAPVITVTSTAVPTSCSQYTLNFTVTDATGGVQEVSVYSRKKSTPVSAFALLKTFTYTTPLASVTCLVPVPIEVRDGTEYYIVAKDSYGTISTYGDLSAPKLLKPNMEAVVTTTKKMIIDLSKLYVNCSFLQTGDKVMAYYENLCGDISLGGITTYGTTTASKRLTVYGNTSTDVLVKNGFYEAEYMQIWVKKVNGDMYEVDVPLYYATSTATIPTANYIGSNVSPFVDFLVNGNTNVIPNGQTIPLVTNDTDFGTIGKGTTKTNIFTLEESGCGTVTYFGVKIIPNTGDFTATLSGNTISITYKGKAKATALVKVLSDVNDYTFQIKGDITECSQTIKYGTTLVTNGDIAPSAAEGTDFGTQSAALTRQFAFASNCNATITGVTASVTNFAVSYTGSTISITYDAKASVLGAITVKASNGDIYTFNVKGTTSPCTETVKYGTVLIPNGDVTPSTTEGTDFGSQSVATTRSFTFGTSCASTIVSATSTSTNFTVSYIGTTVSVRYDAAATTAGTINLTTSKGVVYSFAVNGTKSGTTCSGVTIAPNPIDSWGGNVSVLVTPVAPATTMSLSINVVNATGSLVQVVTNQPQMGSGTHTFYIQGNGLAYGQQYNLVVVRGGVQCTSAFQVKQ